MTPPTGTATRRTAVDPETTPVVVHDFADGCPDDSAEHWKDLAHAMSARAAREYTIWHRDQRTRREYERDLRVSVMRDVREDVLRALDIYLRREVASDLRNLAFHLSRLPADRLRASDLAFVRDAAADLDRRIQAVCPERMPELAELRRLHDAAAMAGRRLHERFGPDLDHLGYCRCPGCELSRDLENAPAVPGAMYRLLHRRILPTEQRDEHWSVVHGPGFDTPAQAAAALRALYQEEQNFAHRYELVTTETPAAGADETDGAGRVGDGAR